MNLGVAASPGKASDQVEIGTGRFPGAGSLFGASTSRVSLAYQDRWADYILGISRLNRFIAGISHQLFPTSFLNSGHCS
jgi:hypothetical protein